MAKEETDISNRWLHKWRGWGARLYRNSGGMAWVGKEVQSEQGTVLLSGARRIPLGIDRKGSGDYIGFKTVEITPEMVGRQVAVFVSIEFKTKDGRVSQEQREWHDFIEKNGGISFYINGVDTQPPSIYKGSSAVLSRNNQRDTKS